MATESGGDDNGDETGDLGTRPATRRWRRLVTNETAATGGVMYTNEGELEFESTFAIFVWRALRNFAMADFEENVEEMVGTKRRVAIESGGDKTGDETGGKTAATAGDERDGVDRWGRIRTKGS